MALSVYRFGSLDLPCPCCGKKIVTETQPIACPSCGANIETFSSEDEADKRIREYGGKKHQGPNGLWLVAYCK